MNYRSRHCQRSGARPSHTTVSVCVGRATRKAERSPTPAITRTSRRVFTRPSRITSGRFRACRARSTTPTRIRATSSTLRTSVSFWRRRASPGAPIRRTSDLLNTSGQNFNSAGGALTSTVASKSQYEVPLTSFNGTSAAYTNPYNGSHQYNYAAKHNPFVFFTATNGGNNPTSSNTQAQNYAPLQQLSTDLTNNAVAKFNWITPDQYNDMHSALNTDFTYKGVTYKAGTDAEQIALGDNFLSIVVPEIEKSQAFKRTARSSSGTTRPRAMRARERRPASRARRSSFPRSPRATPTPTRSPIRIPPTWRRSSRSLGYPDRTAISAGPPARRR